MKKRWFISGLLSTLILSFTSTHASGIQQVKASYVASNYAKTQYPIVLVHGLIGFDRVGLDTFGLDYWYQIGPDLTRNGAHLYMAKVSPVNSTEIRGEQLLQQIDEIIAITGKPKVNLIGHSHGGPTIQYTEGVAPKKVSSLTAIAGSMKGVAIADVIVGSNFLDPLANVVFSLIGKTVNFASGQKFPNDYRNAMTSISEPGSKAFNVKYGSAAIPKDCYSHGEKLTQNGIYHYSWMGNSQVTNLLDIADTIIVSLGVVLSKSTQNDGLVSLCSGNYGQVIRNDYRHNHFDEVNQVLGLRSLFSQDPVALYRQHANRLKLQGL